MPGTSQTGVSVKLHVFFGIQSKCQIQHKSPRGEITFQQAMKLTGENAFFLLYDLDIAHYVLSSLFVLSKQDPDKGMNGQLAKKKYMKNINVH